MIVLHGRGADCNDLAGIAPYLGPASEEKSAGETADADAPSKLRPRGYRFIFPNAPRPFAYGGGFSWFDGWPPEGDSIVESRTLLLRFLEELRARYPIDGDRTVLTGFSQGAMMSLDVGFRTEIPLRGIVMMSGGIHEAGAADFASRRNQPVLIVHGTEDDVIPIIAARRARAVLEAAGITPEYHELPIGHHVSPEELAIVARFLETCMK